MKKVLIIILIFICVEGSAQNKILPDTALARVIVGEVLCKGFPDRKVTVVTNHDQRLETVITKGDTPRLFDFINNTLHIADTAKIRSLFVNSYVLDPAMKPVAANLDMVATVVRQSKYSLYEDIGIDNIYVLYDPGENKCIVYYHTHQGGEQAALLEKINGNWAVSKIETITLE